VDFEETFGTLAAIGFEGDRVVEAFIELPAETASALCVWRLSPAVQRRY
jgi:D-psicose/D-tagatose/L-ribulose 3-epimerase